MSISSLVDSLSTLSLVQQCFEVMPFGHRDVSLYCGLPYLSERDVASLARVNKSYYAWSKIPEIWKQLSVRLGIPLVAGHNRDYEKDFKVLYPVTISASKLSAVFGQVVGPVPLLDPYWFDMFARNAPNPFRKEGTFRQDFVVLVDPAFIERKVNKETPLKLDSRGNLSESIYKEQILKIPFSLRNIRLLSQYSLCERKCTRIFNSGSWESAFTHSTSYPKKVRIWIMSKSILEQSRGKVFEDQSPLIEAIAPRQRFECMTTRVRMIYDLYEILTTGTCSDGRVPEWTYARGSDTITIAGMNYRLCVGSFSPSEGIGVYSFKLAVENQGIVPGGSGESSCVIAT